MITLFVAREIACKEYEKETNELISMLRNSNSKNKNQDLDKIDWFYSFSYFVKKGENTPEYYESLWKLPYEERLQLELKKVRVNIALSTGYFYLSDRVDTVSDTIINMVKVITARKMVNEAEFSGNDSVLKSIPFVTENEIPKPMSFQEQLKHALDVEDYEEAARLRDQIKKLNET